MSSSSQHLLRLLRLRLHVVVVVLLLCAIATSHEVSPFSVASAFSAGVDRSGWTLHFTYNIKCI
jgi:hypothetical protein